MSGTCTRLQGLPHIPVQRACSACAKTCRCALRDCSWGRAKNEEAVQAALTYLTCISSHLTRSVVAWLLPERPRRLRRCAPIKGLGLSAIAGGVPKDSRLGGVSESMRFLSAYGTELYGVSTTIKLKH